MQNQEIPSNEEFMKLTEVLENIGLQLESQENPESPKSPKNYLKFDKSKKILVLQITNGFLREDEDELVLFKMNNIPKTFYTSTDEDCINAYYKIPQEVKEYDVPGFTEGFIADNINTFSESSQNECEFCTLHEGNIVQHFKVHSHDIHELDPNSEILTKLVNARKIFEANSGKTKIPQRLSNSKVLKAYNEYMRDSFIDKSDVQKNKILEELLDTKSIDVPVKTLETLNVTFPLINDTCIKLNKVQELDIEKIRKFLSLFIRRRGLNPNKDNVLENVVLRNITRTRTHTDSENPDMRSPMQKLEELIDEQPQAKYAIFATTKPGIASNIYYIRLDKKTKELVPYNRSCYINRGAIPGLSPERIHNNIWNSEVPMVEMVDDPYEDQVSEARGSLIINMHKRTEYLIKAKAEVSKNIQDNIFYRLYRSVVHPDYIDIMEAWTHTIIWGKEPPIMVPWLATSTKTRGGTGKSLVTLSIPSKILGSAAASIRADDLVGGWGDIFKGKRLLSVEDATNMNKKSWEDFIGSVKQLFSSAEKSINYKFGGIESTKLKIALSGSSNHYIQLDDSDRRFLCLEPAHLDAAVPDIGPLSVDDSNNIDDIIRRDEYSEELQEYVNYLYHLHMQHRKEMPVEITEALYKSAPKTPYNVKWINENRKIQEIFVDSMVEPSTFMDILNVPTDKSDKEKLANYLDYMVKMYEYKMDYIPLSWHWLKGMFLLFTDLDDYILQKISKRNLSKLLDVQFDDKCGFVKKDIIDIVQEIQHTTDINEIEFSEFALSGLKIYISHSAIEDYKEIIKELRGEDDAPVTDVMQDLLKGFEAIDVPETPDVTSDLLKSLETPEAPDVPETPDVMQDLLKSLETPETPDNHKYTPEMLGFIRGYD